MYEFVSQKCCEQIFQFNISLLQSSYQVLGKRKKLNLLWNKSPPAPPILDSSRLRGRSCTTATNCCSSTTQKKAVEYKKIKDPTILTQTQFFIFWVKKWVTP